MPHERSSSRWALFLILTAALLVAGLGAFSFARKVESFQPLGFTAERTAGAWRVTSVSDETVPLEPGDRIVLVNGERPARLGELRRVLRLRSTSELVVERGELLQEILYRLPPLEIDVAYLVLALIGVLYLFIGLYTLFKDRRRQAFIFLLWCLGSTVLYLVSPTGLEDGIDRAIYLVDELARILVAPLTLHLFLVFPEPLGQRVRRIVPFVYLPAAFLVAVQCDLVFLNGRLLLRGGLEGALPILDRLELYHLVAFALAAVILLVARLSRPGGVEQGRQLSWIAVGMAGGYLPFLAFYVAPLSFGVRWPAPVEALTVLPLALVPVTFAYGILRYKLWDVGIIARDAFSLSLTLMVGILGFSLINILLNRAVPDEYSVTRNLLAFLAGTVIAGVLVPVRSGISASLQRLQYRNRFGKRRALAELGQQILHERELHHLSESLLDELSDALDLWRANLYLTQGGLLAPARPEPGLPRTLEPDALGETLWTKRVLSLSGVELPATEPSPSQRLFALGYRYAFPLQVRDNRLGILLAGYRQDSSPLSSDDLDLIQGTLAQAALAIENAKLLDEVHRRLDEVTRLQQFNQGIIESSPAGIAVLDAEERVISANAAFAALVERRPQETAGHSVRELLPVDALPVPGEGLLEARYRREDGEERYLQLNMARLAQRDREGLRVLVVQDISERVAMENALKEKDRLASLGMLAAGVAHEVNTPIAGISSYAQMLLDATPESDPRYELLKKVERQTFRASRIVSNLLDFSRQRPAEAQPVAVAGLFEDVLELLKERIREHRVRLETDLDPEVVVAADGGELQQVFTNLTVNALDAMQEGGGTLRVRTLTEGRWALIEIEDTGRGIAPDQLERIFQPFYSTRLGQGGTGLGLSISYNIVRRYGGELRVVSHPGAGSRFIVELPRAETAAAPSEEADA